MTHEEFEKVAQYWNNKEKTVMPQEQLRQTIELYDEEFYIILI